MVKTNTDIEKKTKQKMYFGGEEYKIEYTITYRVREENRIEPSSIDTDGDGSPDWWEYDYMSKHDNPDTDGDGVNDYEELMFNLDPNSPVTEGKLDIENDGDYDGLKFIDEKRCGTNPNKRDTDEDGIYDGEEVKGIKVSKYMKRIRMAVANLDDKKYEGLGSKVYKTDPLKKDTDDDGIEDYMEVLLGLDPTNPTTFGNTPDSEVKILQKYNDLYDDEDYDTVDDDGESYFDRHSILRKFYIDSVTAEITGYINEKLDISRASGGSSWEFSKGHITDAFTVKMTEDFEVDIYFDLSSMTWLEERLSKLIVVRRLDKDGKMIPVETDIINGKLHTKVGPGTYGVVDAEKAMRELSIDFKKYLK